MNEITVVGLGPGAKEQLTLGALDAMKKAKRLILRTARHGAADWLKAEGIPFETLDKLHDEAVDFDELNQKAADYVLKAAGQGAVAYAVPDPISDASVQAIRKKTEKIRLIAAVTRQDEAMARASAGEKFLITPAASLTVSGAQHTVCVTELDNRLLAGECKLKLMPWYGEEAETLFFAPGTEEPVKIALCDLDRQKKYDHTACAVIKPAGLLQKTRFDAEDLLRLMRLLRGENGCPWDKKQTHQSLRPYLIEEAYETALAIDEGDWEHVADELGDVLLQLALHAVIGEEYGTMEWTDITTLICAKMISRHRHIFGSDTCKTAEEVAANWSRIKQEERGQSTQGEAMLDVKRGLAPIARAEKVQKKARDVGFDWDAPEGALDKVLEEAEEVRAELQNGRHLEEELGDLLFSCVNLARLCGADAEKALSKATDKFISRFVRMENAVISEGKALKYLTMDEMSVYWLRSKMFEV